MSDIEDPVRRQRYRFTRDGADLLAEVHADPGGDAPEHMHPAQTETWEVISGTVTFIIAGERHAASAGDTLRADPGVRHAFVNDGQTTATLQVRVSPAGDLQTFLTKAARYARRGLFNARGMPSSPASALTLTRLLAHHRHDILMTAPPPARLLSRVLRHL